MPFDLPDEETLAEPVQPDAAIAFWKWRTALPYDAIKGLEDGAKERAFYIAGLTEIDAVETVKDAIQQALENGETLEDFKERISDVIASKGWDGHRVETIFRNNMQTAYAAGSYAKMQEVKKQRPYWQYIIVDDDRVRPEHAILSNLVYPADHTFWKTNYPPNGHKCRCTVRTLSQRQLDKEDLSIESDMPSGGLYTDPTTGVTYHVASPGASDGWEGNPGLSWLNGIDLKKHKGLTANSYAEQRLRPRPVKNFEELSEGIKEKCSPFVRNSKGINEVVAANASYFFQTNIRGKIFISKKSFATGKGTFSPYKELKQGWNKLAKGEKLTWLEEYSFEGLWHELVHNQQKFDFARRIGAEERHILEVVTQWTARRTYPMLIESLGGVVSHLTLIKRDGLGYQKALRNFDRLLRFLNVIEGSMLTEMKRLINSAPAHTYTDELATFLSKITGKDRELLRSLLNKTKGTEQEFNNVLQEAKKHFEKN